MQFMAVSRGLNCCCENHLETAIFSFFHYEERKLDRLVFG